MISGREAVLPELQRPQCGVWRLSPHPNQVKAVKVADLFALSLHDELSDSSGSWRIFLTIPSSVWIDCSYIFRTSPC